MPYRWTPDPTTSFQEAAPQDHDAPVLRLDLWPHRSLKGKGFSVTIWIMFAGASLPLLPFIGTIAFWILLIFMMTALAALWIALRRSDRDHLREELLIWPDRVTLNHWTEKGALLSWEANPYWLRLTLHPTNGKLDHYLTLSGGGPGQTREVELGAFLTPKERQTLNDDLSTALRRLSAKRPFSPK